MEPGGCTTRAPDRGERLDAAATVIVEEVASAAADRSAMVSVIIPTFQNRAMIADAVRAALAQTGVAPPEVIVVDDGSTDGTADVLKQIARETSGNLRYLRLDQNRGRAVARNAGIAVARGQVIAFTDGDCVPTESWLAKGLGRLADSRVGIVQGPTRPLPGQSRPFFNHFIEIEHFDGTFSTCNVFYRRDALVEVGGFDPEIVYWEDVDLGWRVRRAGWAAAFAPTAVVYHQVIRLSPLRWLRWPLHFRYLPAKAARYPEYRRHLFLGVWVSWFHLLFDLAALAALLGIFRDRRFFALTAPYAIAFPFRHGLGGRWPLLKGLLHVAWDVGSFGVLVVSSVRHRSPVL